MRVAGFIKATKETRYKGVLPQIVIGLFGLALMLLSFFFCGFYETDMEPRGFASDLMQ